MWGWSSPQLREPLGQSLSLTLAYTTRLLWAKRCGCLVLPPPHPGLPTPASPLLSQKSKREEKKETLAGIRYSANLSRIDFPFDTRADNSLQRYLGQKPRLSKIMLASN